MDVQPINYLANMGASMTDPIWSHELEDVTHVKVL